MSSRGIRRLNSGPIVGILAGRSPAERYSLHEGYVHAVAAIGASPLILPVGPDTDIDRLLAQILACDALIVSGGDDVSPELSGIDDPAAAHGSDRARDNAEIAAILGAIDSGRAVLGICRGAQILAVAYGGSLVGDLASAGFAHHDEFERQYETVHAISADAGSVVAGVLGHVTDVNSAHHQAVAVPGDNFRATAWSPDGVIEATEGPGAIGIQWHPERLCRTDARHLAPFEWLLA